MTVPVSEDKVVTNNASLKGTKANTNANPAVLSVMNIRDAVASIVFIASFIIPFMLYAPVVWPWLAKYADFNIFLLGSFVQPSKMPVKAWYIKAGKQALFNWIFVNFPTGLTAYCIIAYGQQRSITTEPLPTLSTLLLHLAAFAVVEEIGFYYSHRLFHHPRIYKYIHKRHHEFTAPIGIAAIYAHPIEHLFANLLPLFAGPIIMQSHVMVFWLWLCIGLVNTINSHCGFALPFMPSPLDHDYHHQVFNANYGVLGVLDTLHNTRGGFEAWRSSWRPEDSEEQDESSNNTHTSMKQD
ncbi:hypothetical protein BDF19DRAFT_433580 [Syncephalis fuscata]|nr:hypothetical protein BDF19DRAFT_433580 [Syncephalis fuscata]